MNDENQPTPPRPLGIAHLVFGLIFGGIAAVWLIGEANDADYPDLAAGLPAVLIAAGIIGLVAAVISARRTRRVATTPVQTPGHTPEHTTENTPEDTLVLDHEEDAR